MQNRYCSQYLLFSFFFFFVFFFLLFFYSACASSKPNASIHPVRNEKKKRKIRCPTIFKIKVCSPHPPLEQANPLYNRLILSIYTKYVNEKLDQGEGVGTIFSKPKKMSGQNPVWKKFTQMTLKMGSMSHNHCQIFASCHLCKSVQDYY